MSSLVVYCILVLDNLQTLSAVLFGILTFFSCLTFAVYMIEIENKNYPMNKLNSIKKILVSVTIVVLLIMAFAPSSKQAALIYLFPKIVNNEKINHIPDKILDLVNKQLDEWTKENLE